MNNFNLSENPIFKVYKKYQLLSGGIFKFIHYLSITLLAIMVIIFAFLLMNILSISNLIIGLILILSSIIIIYLCFDLYLRAKIDDFTPPLSASRALSRINVGSQINWALCLGYHSFIAFYWAQRIAKKLNSQITPKTLLAGITKTNRGKYLLLRMGINLVDLDHLPNKETGKNMDSVMVTAAKQAAKEGHLEITIGDLILGIFDSDPIFKEAAERSQINREDIENVVYWDYNLIAKFKEKNRYWEEANIIRTGGIGKYWASNYTNILDRFSEDLKLVVSGLPYDVIGHNREISELERLLIRSQKRNVVLVGEPGIGKKTIILGFAKKIAEGKAKPFQLGKRVVRLDVARLLSGASEQGEIEERILLVFNEAALAGNVIIFIENIDNLFNSSGGEGTVDASHVILPFLNSAKLQIIGTMSFKAYHNLIQSNITLSGIFEHIEVLEPDTQQTIRIVEDVVLPIEFKTGSFVTYPAIKAAVDLSGRYIHDKPYPEKAIDLLDETITYCAVDLHKKIITAEDVEAVISQRTKIPVGRVKKEEKEKLLRLEEFLHQRIVDQDEAIKTIADAMRRARAGLSSKKRPIGNFLFLGPTGVGKTETCKALAENYFGSEKNMIRLDMSEYQSPESAANLIGSSSGGKFTAGILTKSIQDNPFSLILLDEIEKANPKILNLFLQVMDDGRLTGGSGKIIDFTNAILIATSNAGAEFIRESIKEKAIKDFKDKLLDYLQSKGIFRPEFLNRFDAVVTFKPLSQSEILQIAQMMVDNLNKRLAKKNIKVEIPSDVLAKLAELGYNPEMGARPMRRVIQDKVENVIAKKLLSGELERGQTYKINSRDIS